MEHLCRRGPAGEMTGGQDQGTASLVAHLFPGQFGSPESTIAELYRAAILRANFNRGHELPVYELRTGMG